MRWLLILMLLGVAFSGCLGGDEAPDDGGNTGTGDGDGDGTGGNQTDPEPEPEPFEPQDESWDGSTSSQFCALSETGGSCMGPGLEDADNSRTIAVPEGATLASFEFTWTGPGVLHVYVSGDPLADAVSQESSSKPLSFTVDLEDTGDMYVMVRHTVADTEGARAETITEFHMDLVLS